MGVQAKPDMATFEAVKANYSLTAEQRQIVDHVDRVAREVLHPLQEKMDAEEWWPDDLFRQMGELGLLGITAPEALGGSGQNEFTQALVSQIISKWNPAVGLSHGAHDNLCLNNLLRNSSADQVAKYIPGLCSGELVGALGLTEPGAGSDAGSLKTRAELAGHEYIINGAKAFISGAGSTDMLVLMARTGDAGSGASGISAFAVPADLPGISYGKKEEKMGWNSQPTRVISFDNVRIPAHNLLGREGEGFKIAMKGLDGGRINIATCSVGAAQGALTQAQQYMHERKQFGKPIASFQALQFKLADMATELVAARQMVRLAASKLDAGARDASTYCAMAKRFATDAGFMVCNEALQLHGGYGYIREYPLERLMRDARVHQILEGTNEIMRVIIARRMLEGDAPDMIR